MRPIIIPTYIESLISLLENSGFEAFIVGGCVRDSLMGIAPSDYDMTTNATPEQIKSVFSSYRTVDTGISHGTVTVISEGKPVEITTYRIDGTYQNHRKPESVTFSGDLSEDLCRRDFTVNAMAYNSHTGLIDLYNGQADLDAHIIRCVGEPKKRFTEDALRILRGLRFAATFGFSIDSDTEDAMCSCAHFLDSISAERKRAELEKFLLAPYFETYFVRRFDILTEVIPKLKEFAECRIEIAESVARAPKQIDIRLALLLYGLSPEDAVSAVKELRFDKNTVDSVTTLLQNRDIVLPQTRSDIKHIMNKLGVIIAKKLFLMNIALNPHQKSEYLRALEIFDEIILLNEPYTREMLKVDGKDLEQFGIKGRDIGTGLEKLLSDVIDEKVKNERDALLAHLASM